jgi:protease-4
MNAFLANLLNSPILISEEGARAYAHLLLPAFEGRSSLPSKESIAEIVLSQASYKLSSPENTNSTGAQFVAVVSIVGGISKYNQECGPKGMVTKEKEIKQALMDPSIIGIVLKLDTPGGEASYLETLSETIRAANKPIVALVEGDACSAGYWIASSTKEIYLNSKMDRVGSIGAYITLADMNGYYEKKGIKIEEIYAPQSTEKNKEYRDVFAATSSKVAMENRLKDLVNIFIEEVNTNRSITDKKALAGAVFMGQKAIDIGLADGIKNLDACVARVYELSQLTKNKTEMSTSEKKYPAIAKVAFAEDVDSNLALVDGEASLNEASLDSIEDSLNRLATAEIDLSTATNALTTAEAELTAEEASNRLLNSIATHAAILLGIENPKTTADVDAINLALTKLNEEHKVFAGKQAESKTTTGSESDVYSTKIASSFAHNQKADEIASKK